MQTLQLIADGIVYRNPLSHVRSIHAYFPSTVQLQDGELLCTLVLAEAFEAVNARTYLARSQDGGVTWQLEDALPAATPDRLTSNSARLSVFDNDELVAFMVRADRSAHPNEGLANPLNMGFVPTELLLLRSTDRGRSWSAPVTMQAPLEGPSFELCAPIVELRDGRWVLATSTWRSWDGASPNGNRQLMLVSPDKGHSWPHYDTVMHDPQQHIIYWESKIVELEDGRLLSVAWAYDEKAAVDLPNQYALSEDGGKTWCRPRSTGLLGQTMAPTLLPNGRILSVYRRLDEAGLWANISRIEGDNWINESCLPLWGVRAKDLVKTESNMAENFTVLRFGAPCLTHLHDGSIFGAFWCYDDCVSEIRWFKLKYD
jgi:hypothetical protein